MTNVQNKLLEALRKRQELEAKRKATEAENLAQNTKHIKFEPKPSQNTQTQNTPTQDNIILNPRQLQAVDLSSHGKSFCLIGAAGTGKTTTLKEVAKVIQQLLGNSFGQESLVLCAYTNRAVRNLALAVRDLGFDKYAKTIHKWLEFAPVYYDILGDDGKYRTTMRFEPKRTAQNPLNAKIVVIDESSMVEPELHQQLVDACPNANFIYVGDINQIPPVFGMPILGYKLNELPVIELDTVYRQAMESPIIAFQHNFTLKGVAPTDTQLKQLNEQHKDNGLSFKPFKQTSTDPYIMAEAVAHYMFKNYKEGIYDPTQDTILIPYNKSFGTTHTNLHLANLLGKDRNAVVHEVKSGFQNLFLAVGDFVMFEKQECNILEIKPNPSYFGERCLEPSTELNRFGTYMGKEGAKSNLLSPTSILDLNADHLDAMASEEDLTRQGSHIITLEVIEDGQLLEIKTSGDLNKLEFGYSMTVHKSQGSEWRKVWFVLCRQHRAMLSREILYTGMTRAKEFLEVIYTPQTQIGRRDNSIARAISNPRFPGTTWQQKAQRFKEV